MRQITTFVGGGGYETKNEWNTVVCCAHACFINLNVFTLRYYEYMFTCLRVSNTLVNNLQL